MKVMNCLFGYNEPFPKVGLINTNRFKDITVYLVLPKYQSNKDEIDYDMLGVDRNNVFFVNTVFNFHHSVRLYLFGLFSLLRDIKPDIVYINYEPWSMLAFQVVLICQLLKLPTKIAVYTAENQMRRYPIPFRWMEQYVLKKVSLMTPVTKYEGEKILREVKKYKGSIEHLPLSVNTSFFCESTKTNRLREPGKGFVIGYIGRFVSEKGINSLLEAISLLDNDCRLVLIGDGCQRAEIESTIKRNDLFKRVRLVGSVDKRSLPLYLNSLDTIVLPSVTTKNWKEQFGRVLIEAMASGVPVIGSSSGEIPQVIGDAGLVFSEGNTQELVHCINRLRNDVCLYNNLKQRGREKVEALFSEDVVMGKVVSLFRSMLH